MVRGTLLVTMLAASNMQIQAARPVAATGLVRHWTMDDILTAPQVVALSRSVDGQSALVVTRAADVGRDVDVSELWVIDLKSRQRRLLLRAAFIENLRRVPGTATWNILADVGAGVQLYRLGRTGALTAEVINPSPVQGGATDDSTRQMAIADPPRLIGVASYDRSPDGRSLWYSVVKPALGRPATLRNEELGPVMGRFRPRADATIEYHLRTPDGIDHLVATRPIADRVAAYAGGNVTWKGGVLRYLQEDGRDGQRTYRAVEVSLVNGVSKPVTQTLADPFGATVLGPDGGRLATEGFGEARRLVEITVDGQKKDRGPAAFLLDDPRSAGHWLSDDGVSALVGTRILDQKRFGLEWIDSKERHAVETDASLTKCDFSGSLEDGICIRESQVMAPQLVRVRPRTGGVEHIVDISPRHSAITPLAVTSKVWSNRLGFKASGFIVWPRGYKAGQRYPAIVVTHGSDADERFVRREMQWNYPVQLWAEQGYVVLLINDPMSAQDARLSGADAQWATRHGPYTPEQMRELLFLNGVYTFEDALQELIASGAIDPERVGIAGYSRGSQMTNVAMTQSRRFRVASSGDGDLPEPIGYVAAQPGYDALFGGSPFGPAAVHYKALSPSLRADVANGPVLLQVATPLPGAVEFYRSLRAADVPAEITFYPGETSQSDETHIFHIPSNRRAAMDENLAWFDFWLFERRREGLITADHYNAWAAMGQASVHSHIKP